MSDISTPYFQRQTEAAPLAVFRILFGLMMLISLIRFWFNGWIQKLYIAPSFFFSYYGFDWIAPIGDWTYLIFILCAISAIGITLGFKYRLSVIVFFLSFTYIELMDKTTYLNHYYFVSLVSFLMIFLPANAYYSMDAKQDQNIRTQFVPNWSIDAIKLMLGIVYFYAGLAKLNSDWLLHAMPLKIWLPGRYDLPIIGGMLDKVWVHYAFSWGGAFYDLFIPFLLLYKPTRWLAFAAVVFFHLITRILFPIGMFPYIMILSSLIFFENKYHHVLLNTLSNWFKWNKSLFDNHQYWKGNKTFWTGLKVKGLIVFFALQLLIPFRYLMYPGELFWTEEGFRFSWRVMLMEKSGYSTFKVVNGETGKWFLVNNSEFLTTFQEKQMSFQPDMMLEYAHFLHDHFSSREQEQIEIYVDSYVALNGRLSQRYIDPTVDLAKVKRSFKHKDWILPFDDEIKGL
ncbi:MAG: HTTM domain-containing protein [Reichenbachiella sp.]